MDAGDWVQVASTIVGVGLGVFLAEWATRVRTRRDRLERAVQEVAALLPHVTLGMLEAMPGRDPIDTSYGSTWQHREERLTSLFGEMRTLARWPLRRHDEIRLEVDDLAARVGAAWLRYGLDGRPLTAAEYNHVTTLGLQRTVFGESTQLDDVVTHYRTRGMNSEERMADRFA